MTIARLVLEYLQTFAWPLVVFAGLLLFRPQLSHLLARISHVKFPGGAELDLQVDQVTERAKRELDRTPEVQEIGRGDSEILRIIRTDPTLGMAALRIELERILRALVRSQPPGYPELRRFTGPSVLAQQLQDSGVLSEPVAGLLQDVIQLANRAAHGESVSQQAAQRLGAIGVALLDDLRDQYRQQTMKPVKSSAISHDKRDELARARLKVTTVVPLVDYPLLNVRELDQEGLDWLLDGYDEVAEFIVAVEPVETEIPEKDS